jgi:hypothetical protein
VYALRCWTRLSNRQRLSVEDSMVVSIGKLNRDQFYFARYEKPEAALAAKQ